MKTKFGLYYDDEYDADIERVKQETPTHRRSERFRELIRLGLAAEAGSLSIKPTSPPAKPQVEQQPSTSPSQVEPTGIKRSVSFRPPD